MEEQDKEDFKYQVFETEDGQAISFEDLYKMVMEQVEDTPTVEEAIKEKKEMDKMTKDGFKLVREVYGDVSFVRRRLVTHLNLSKLRLQALKAFFLLINTNATQMINEVDSRIDVTLDEAKKQKILLKSIKKAMKQLESNNIGFFTFDFCRLFALLMEKDSLMVDMLDSDINMIKLANEGITYYGTNKNQESLDKVNERIDKTTMRLGLKK